MRNPDLVLPHSLCYAVRSNLRDTTDEVWTAQREHPCDDRRGDEGDDDRAIACRRLDGRLKKAKPFVVPGAALSMIRQVK